MRLITVLLLSCFALSACAGRSAPAHLQPLPPPPAYDAAARDDAGAAVVKRTNGASGDANEPGASAGKPRAADDTSGDADEPKVSITEKSGPDRTEKQYRIGGRLYMIEVTPKIGPPYYLIDNLGDGQFIRKGSIDAGFRPPQWVIRRF